MSILSRASLSDLGDNQYLGLPDIRALLNLSYYQYRKLSARASFPEPDFYLGPRSPRWKASTIKAWVSEMAKQACKGK